MPLVVEIVEPEIEVRTVNGKRGDFQVRSQAGYLHGLGAYPERLEVTLPDNHPGYAPGRYDIDEKKSVYLDKYRKPNFGRLILVPRK